MTRYKNPAYIRWIKKQDCINCETPGPSDPHHEIGVGDGKTGSKAGDDRAMPLCRTCHRRFHDTTGEVRLHWIAAQAMWIHICQDRYKREKGIDIRHIVAEIDGAATSS